MSFKFETGDHVTYRDLHNAVCFGFVVGRGYIRGEPHYNIQITTQGCDPHNYGIMFHVSESKMNWHNCPGKIKTDSVQDPYDAFDRAMRGI